jgi:hypothetical protein
MPWIATIMMALCAGALLIWTIVQQYRERRWARMALVVLGLFAYGALLNALFSFRGPDGLIPKGPEDEAFLPLVLAMYACMLLACSWGWLPSSSTTDLIHPSPSAGRSTLAAS